MFILFLVLRYGLREKSYPFRDYAFCPAKGGNETRLTLSRKKNQQRKLEAPAPDPLSVQERERKIKEEALREETLREKSLREKLQGGDGPKEASGPGSRSEEDKSGIDLFRFRPGGHCEDQKEIMMKNAQWLKANPQARIKIEGNCDERGTAEYNLALGQRRADAAKDFLEGLGIDSKRMQTISYGFERPLASGP